MIKQHLFVLFLFLGALVLSLDAGNAKTLTNSVGMKFAPIPAGKFTMGSPDTERDRGRDEEQHEVAITKPFYLGVHEVTQGEYEKVLGKNPSFFSAVGPGKQRVANKNPSDHPVEMVTWNDATAFCGKLSELPAEKAAKRAYRLPTEAEWEYACRAGTKTPLHFGEGMDSTFANFNGLSPYNSNDGGPFFRSTVRVAEYKANDWGIFDMHANVQEWCSDWYAADYYKKSPMADPQGPLEGTKRVLRGGGWPNAGKSCRSAFRNKLGPDQANYSAGFRVVLNAN
jgi:formylglycine-generating enzyme required for sulfatase activity